ncbi:MAG: hypothetical protein RL272_1053 [Candidatus Parcubacteria bacterium]|jgi:non-canonical purine NTP pyrophosphatase (RdgB/HAM1 family)
MAISFITGNAGKFAEARAIIPDLEMLEMDLPEIQEIDARAIIAAKLAEAVRRAHGREIVVEDTSLSMRCLGGLPGPLIKWFLQSMGIAGLHAAAEKLADDQAVAKTIVGYADAAGRTSFFEGVVHGRIVAPRGETSFGWDPIFEPAGHGKTFAEMTRAEKNGLSMRRLAFAGLKEFLDGR